MDLLYFNLFRIKLIDFFFYLKNKSKNNVNVLKSLTKK